jgi:hypothetical protein
MQVAHRLYEPQPMKMPLLQKWNESRGEAHAMSHQNWNYPNQGSSRYFMMIICIRATNCEMHDCFQIVLYACKFAIDYNINTL